MEGPQDKRTADSVGMAHIAKSVTTLAKAVSDLQKQMKTLEERISDQEASTNFTNGIQARKKKREFLRAYNAVISIMKALKIMPEMKDFIANEVDGTTRDSPNQQSPSAVPIKNAQLLRTIALTLSDMETVASYVTQDDVSTAEASTMSRPADFVKIEHYDSTNQMEEKPMRSKELDSLKELLIAKDEQMHALMLETKLQTQMLDKKSSRWIQIQFLSILFLLGAMCMGNSSDFLLQKIFERIDLNTVNSTNEMAPMDSIELSGLDNFPKEDIEYEHAAHFNDNGTEDVSQEPSIVSENRHTIPVVEVDSEVEAMTHKITNASTVNDNEVIAIAHESSDTSTVNDKEAVAIYHEITNVSTINDNDAVAKAEESMAASTTNETDDTISEFLEPDENVNAIQNIASESTGGERNARHFFTIKRSWLEKNLCEELSDMMQCAETRTVIYHTTRERPNKAKTKDVQSMHRMMIRRQVFTAVGVAAAMTLPKIAPHIFKINLTQVLSLSFWRSFMEFVTEIIQ